MHYLPLRDLPALHLRCTSSWDQMVSAFFFICFSSLLSLSDLVPQGQKRNISYHNRLYDTHTGCNANLVW